MIRYCSSCGHETSVFADSRRVTYEIKGRDVAIVEDVLICTECGSAISDGVLDERNLLKAFSEYRKMEGVLGPDEIKGIRARWGLSQRGLAAILGWSPSTIARYEGGAIASVPHNEQLKRFREDLGYAKELLRSGVGKLNRLEARRVAESLELAQGLSGRGASVGHLLAYVDESYSSFNRGLYGGNRDFDIDRLANAVVFFAQECGGIVKSKLLKLLWYTDFLSFKLSGRSITGTVYCHNYFGPIPLSHDAVLAYLREAGIIEARPYEGRYEGEYFTAKVELDSTVFSDDELSVLRDVCRRFRRATARGMTKTTHAERAYTDTEMNAPIPYTYAADLKTLS